MNVGRELAVCAEMCLGDPDNQVHNRLEGYRRHILDWKERCVWGIQITNNILDWKDMGAMY